MEDTRYACLLPFRLVCRDFIPEKYVKYIKFHPLCMEDKIVSILRLKNDLKMLDFTGSLYLTTDVFRQIYFHWESVSLFVLDKCNRIRLVPCSCVSTTMNFNRNGKSVIVLLRGVGILFQSPCIV